MFSVVLIILALIYLQGCNVILGGFWAETFKVWKPLPLPLWLAPGTCFSQVSPPLGTLALVLMKKRVESVDWLDTAKLKIVTTPKKLEDLYYILLWTLHLFLFVMPFDKVNFLKRKNVVFWLAKLTKRTGPQLQVSHKKSIDWLLPGPSGGMSG